MISIKGLKQGLLIVFSKESEPWLSKLRELESKLSANESFFQGAQVAFDVGPASLTSADLRRAIDVLSERNVTLFCVLSSNVRTLAAAEELGLKIALPAAAPRMRDTRKRVETDTLSTTAPEKSATDAPATNGAQSAADHVAVAGAAVAEAEPAAKAEPATEPGAVGDEEQEHGTDGALLKKRVRSGQMVRHPGHIVIIGDVNPGAQVIAGGDIIVWGKLQGTAHAGAYGNADAVICALDLSPSLLKIADLTIRSHRGKAEMARVKDQEIVFTKWDNKT